MKVLSRIRSKLGRFLAGVILPPLVASSLSDPHGLAVRRDETDEEFRQRVKAIASRAPEGRS